MSSYGLLNKRMGILFFCLFLLLSSSACKERVKMLPEYVAWLNDTSNGMVQSKTVHGLRITVKYIPAEYIVCRQIQRDSHLQAHRDSLMHIQGKNKTFLLSLSPDSATGFYGNVVMRGITNYEEFTERVMLFNFRMGEYVRLGMGGERYEAVLTTLDNVYGLNKDATFTVVYQMDSAIEDDVVFTFNDMVFSTGIHHFVFSKEDLQNIPSLQI